jgi:hypothetical protein
MTRGTKYFRSIRVAMPLPSNSNISGLVSDGRLRVETSK